jgi:hypothetical protein
VGLYCELSKRSKWCLYTNLRVEMMAIAGTMDTGSTKKDKDQSMLMKELLPLSTKSQGPNNEALYHNNRQTFGPVTVVPTNPITSLIVRFVILSKVLRDVV